MKKILKMLKGRLKEGSTYAALAAVMVYFGLKPEDANVLMDAVVILLGLIGFSVKDSGTPAENG